MILFHLREDGKKYSGFKEHELNMIFTFEHMNVDNGSNSKWSAERFKLSKLTELRNSDQLGLKYADSLKALLDLETKYTTCDGKDLQDTLQANRERCVGMAAERKTKSSTL